MLIYVRILRALPSAAAIAFCCVIPVLEPLPAGLVWFLIAVGCMAASLSYFAVMRPDDNYWYGSEGRDIVTFHRNVVGQIQDLVRLEGKSCEALELSPVTQLGWRYPSLMQRLANFYNYLWTGKSEHGMIMFKTYERNFAREPLVSNHGRQDWQITVYWLNLHRGYVQSTQYNKTIVRYPGHQDIYGQTLNESIADSGYYPFNYPRQSVKRVDTEIALVAISYAVRAAHQSAVLA